MEANFSLPATSSTAEALADVTSGPLPDTNPLPPSQFLRIGVPIIAIVGVVLVFVLAYFSAFYLPDTRAFQYITQLLSCEKGKDEPEDRQTFLKKRRNSLVKRLKHYRDEARKHPRVLVEPDPEDNIEYATPYPETPPANERTTSAGAVPRTSPAFTFNSPAAVGAAASIDVIREELPGMERHVNKPRPVAYVRPIRPPVEKDLYVIKVPSLMNISQEIIKAEIHQPRLEFRPEPDGITGVPDLAGNSGFIKHCNKSTDGLNLSRDSGLNESPFTSSQPTRTSTPRSPLVDGLGPRRTPVKSVSMQNLNSRLGSNKTLGVGSPKQNSVVYENYAYNASSEDLPARRAQSVSNIALTGALAASQDISV